MAKAAHRITREELEAVFPWVQYLPDDAIAQFMAIIDNYRAGAEIYSRRNPAA